MVSKCNLSASKIYTKIYTEIPEQTTEKFRHFSMNYLYLSILKENMKKKRSVPIAERRFLKI